METQSQGVGIDLSGAGSSGLTLSRSHADVAISAARIALLLLVVALWWSSLFSIDPYSLTDYGLAAQVSWEFFAALGLLTLGFVLAVRSPSSPTLVLLLHVLILVLILHGTLPIVYDVPRYTYTYKHIGVVDYIQRHGSVDPSIDIYHNWPGFFALVALLADVSGIGSTTRFAGWAPTLFEVMYLFPILMLYQSCTRDRRLAWTAAWIFYLGNWIGQDYFAPQALSYFLYIAIFAIILRWLKPTEPPGLQLVQRWTRFGFVAEWVHFVLRRAHECDVPRWKHRQSVLIGAQAAALLAFGVIVSGHQLTPFAVVSGTLALVAFRQSTARAMPLLMAAMVVLWLNSMAETYVSANLPVVAEGAGRFFQNVGANVSDISQSSPGRVFVALSSRVLTGAVWLLAIIGVARRLRAGYWDLSMVLLALSPIPLLAAQSYGGEMGFRVYLFTLPFVAFLGAGALFPCTRVGHSPVTVAAAILLGWTLTAGFSFAHYGNERINFVTPRELDACEYLYTTAEPGSLILAGAVNTPALFANYESYVHQSLTEWPDFRGRKLGTPEDVDAIDHILSDERYPAAYLIISRGQKEYVDLMSVAPRGALADLETALIRSGRFEIVLDTGDAKIFTVDRER